MSLTLTPAEVAHLRTLALRKTPDELGLLGDTFDTGVEAGAIELARSILLREFQ